MSSLGVWRVGERTMPAWRLLARQGVGEGCYSCQGGSQFFSISPGRLPRPAALALSSGRWAVTFGHTAFPVFVATRTRHSGVPEVSQSLRTEARELTEP